MKARTIWAVALGAAALLLCAREGVAGKPPPPPPPPPADPAIAFCWGGSLKVMNADGTNQVVLVQATMNSRGKRGVTSGDPDWSPDGLEIAFASNADDPNGSGLGVYVVNRDGTGRHKIVSPLPSRYGVFGLAPAWSPAPVPGIGGDRARIAFTSPAAADGPLHLWLADVDGANLVDLGGVPGADVLFPTWSPSSTRLLCEVYASGVRDPFASVDFAGSGALETGTYPTPLAGHDVGRPSWGKSHETAMVVEASLDWPTSTTETWDLWSLDPTNLLAAPTNLTNTSSATNAYYNESHGSFSPDDSRIVFSTSGLGIEIMNADGTGRHALSVSGLMPAWRRNP